MFAAAGAKRRRLFAGLRKKASKRLCSFAAQSAAKTAITSFIPFPGIDASCSPTNTRAVPPIHACRQPRGANAGGWCQLHRTQQAVHLLCSAKSGLGSGAGAGAVAGAVSGAGGPWVSHGNAVSSDAVCFTPRNLPLDPPLSTLHAQEYTVQVTKYFPGATPKTTTCSGTIDLPDAPGDAVVSAQRWAAQQCACGFGSSTCLRTCSPAPPLMNP